MNVSVIINTLNRDFFLKRLLDAIIHQTYNNFEIVVVNGPSTDKTDEILQSYKDIIKLEKCDAPNISVSRNIGIKAASGDILIFIDDDAVPITKYWIEHYVNAFISDSQLGCTGGKVYDSFGKLEFNAGGVSIWGKPYRFYYEAKDIEQDIFFNQAKGCNCAFLRKSLIEIGGFDEYFDYYLDESDVALRIYRLGYNVYHHSYANVYHENAYTWDNKPRVFLNWYTICKNQAYFGFKNSKDYFDFETCKTNIIKEALVFKNNFKNYLKNKYITKSEYKSFIEMYNKGINQGEYDGLNSKRQLRYDLENIYNFKKINKIDTTKQLNVIFLLPVSVNDNGGSGKHTRELSQGLYKLGVNVHIIYCGSENIDYLENGINYYSVSPSPFFLNELKSFPLCNNVLKLSYAVYKKARMLTKMYNINIIETPLWDFAGLFCAECLDIPVVTRLQTPAKIVNKTHNKNETDDNLLFYEFEKRLINSSAGIISISDCIADTIKYSYNIQYNNKLFKNYLGINEFEFKDAKRSDNKLIIFFIGRLERRKGLANIFEVIPNILAKHKNIEFRFAGSDIYDNIYKTTFKKYFYRKYKRYNKNIAFLGEISDRQKDDEFELCDIFLSPSLYESFGIIFLEAMRHKKPVIGCYAGGMPEIIIDGETGFLCQPDNSPDLEKALLTLIENKTLRESMGNNGYNRFKSMFTQETMCKGTLDIYNKVLTNYVKKV